MALPSSASGHVLVGSPEGRVRWPNGRGARWPEEPVAFWRPGGRRSGRRSVRGSGRRSGSSRVIPFVAPVATGGLGGLTTGQLRDVGTGSFRGYFVG